jgi:hypothetical protein
VIPVERRERALRSAISARAGGWALGVAVGLLIVGGMWNPWFGGQ